jgi:radical SAM protein with 4Fe4S-binding SPASM domain
MRQAPDYIQFYPTLRCNRSCDFCFNRGLPPARDMSVDVFRTMLRKMPQGVKTIDMIGGEPTVHESIVMLIRHAIDTGFSVNVSSNGTNLARLHDIMGLGGWVTVGISVNDREALGLLADFIRSSRPIVKSVYTQNMDLTLVADILALAPQRFYLIYRDALEREDLDKTVPFPEFLDAASRFPPDQAGSVYCSGFLPDARNYPDLASVRCPAGTTKLGIMPDGSVYPCNLFFSRPEFLLGNILTDSFDSIWNHPTLAFFRTEDPNGCPETDCRLHDRCHGGCPAHSMMLGGKLDGPDPRCARPRSSS